MSESSNHHDDPTWPHRRPPGFWHIGNRHTIHPYAIICFNHSPVHLSVGTNSTRLYQEFTCSTLNTTVSFDPCPFSLAFVATKRHCYVKFGSPLNLLASSRSDIGTSLGKNVDLFGLFRWITKTPGFLRGAAECCHFCWFGKTEGMGASRIWWKYGNHTFYFNTYIIYNICFIISEWKDLGDIRMIVLSYRKNFNQLVLLV